MSPGYFQAMGIPLLRGRDLSFADAEKSPGVGVINRAMAEREWPGQDPIGKRVMFGGSPSDPDAWVTIVGVVGNSKRADLATEHHTGTVYLHSAIPAAVHVGGGQERGGSRRRSPRRCAPACARSIRTCRLTKCRRSSHAIETVTGQPRFRAVLIGAFAATALLLAAVGLYGLISYTVVARVPEMGVRLALGANPRQVARLVINQGLRLAATGIAIGIAGALALARLIQGLLFSISATDPAVYAGLAVLLLLIAALACYVPARRAMRIDPMTALRAE